MLAGDALQAEAFRTLLHSGIEVLKTNEMARILSEAAGPEGICGGQYLDLRSDGKQRGIDELLELYRMKTTALISAAARMGVVAGGGSQEQIDAAGYYANSVGLAFQLRDDILDYSSTAEEFGKPIGSDRENNKTTIASLIGTSGCEKMIWEETEKAIEAISGRFSDTSFLSWLARFLSDRKS